MEGAPPKIDQTKLINEMKAVAEGVAVHDFHLWQISMGVCALSCHVHCKGNPMQVLKDVTTICKGKPYKINHLTIQIEDLDDINLECEQHVHMEYNPDAEEGHGH